MKWLTKRFSERSTWASLGTAIAAGGAASMGLVSPAEGIAAVLALLVPMITPEAPKEGN